MDDACSTQNTINLFLVALTAAMVTLQQVFSYFRHKHIMSDNTRILNVVENVAQAKPYDPKL